MCDHTHLRGTRWKGWLEIPAPVPAQSKAPWIDISHRLTETLSAIPHFPRPVFERLRSLPEDEANLTRISMVVHHGTHVDAPNHFIADAPAFDEIPLERLWGPGVVWSLEVAEFGLIDVADLEAARPRMRPGDIVLLDTGWARKVDTPAYRRHASLTPAAAEWLLARRAKMVGVDCATPDLAPSIRGEGFWWPVHHILLPHGVLIAEHVANLDRLSNRRIEAIFAGLSIAGSDGGPVRALARPVD